MSIVRWNIVRCIFIAALFSGCVPLPIYEELQKKVSAVEADKNILKKKAYACADQNRKLAEELKAAKLPVKNPIDKSELDEIKKQSLREAEKGYRDRVKRRND